MLDPELRGAEHNVDTDLAARTGHQQVTIESGKDGLDVPGYMGLSSRQHRHLKFSVL